jgi:excisionase family DNA binding protein
MPEGAMVMTTERYFTVREIAEKLAVTEFTVRNWLRAGRLGGLRVGGDRAGWRIAESDLEAFLRSAREQSTRDRDEENK